MSDTPTTAEVSYGGGEKPRYAALRHAVNAYYAALLPPLQRLRAATFRAVTLADPGKEGEGAFRYLGVTQRVIDDAVDLFLTEMAGPVRTREGFVDGNPLHPEGVLQNQNLALFGTGITRGAELMDATPTLRADRQSPAVKQMLDAAFTRLSENGKLRLDDVRDDIHSVLTSAQDAGLSPLDTARQLAGQFDDYKGWEFQRLARTEAAFASEAGVRGQMADLGVEQVAILVSADACDVCEGYDGQTFAIDDDDNLPPYHPNCLCSVAPVTPEEGGDQPDVG